MKKPDQELSYDVTVGDHVMHFQTTWGLFSPRSMDDGTWLLLKNVAKLEVATKVLDIGCGYGALGVTIGKFFPKASVDMIDKDFVAVEYAQRNAASHGLEKAKVYLSNGLSHVPRRMEYDLVVSNIPAKVGREMLLTMFMDAYEHMLPGAIFYVVCINGLKDFVKGNFTQVFGKAHKGKGGKTYCCYYGIK